MQNELFNQNKMDPLKSAADSQNAPGTFPKRYSWIAFFTVFIGSDMKKRTDTKTQTEQEYHCLFYKFY